MTSGSLVEWLRPATAALIAALLLDYAVRTTPVSTAEPEAPAPPGSADRPNSGVGG